MLDNQTFIKSGGTGATLQGAWYIGTTGGAAPAAGTLNGPLNGNATSASTLLTKRAINGVDFDGSAAITVPVNTTSNPTSGTYYPIFVPSSGAGNQQASTSNSTGFTFNPATNALTVSGNIGAANFSGSSSGTNTGDQNLSGYALLSGATFTGTIGAANFSGSSSGTNTGDQNLAPYAVAANLATVATSGSYNDLSNKPVTGVSSVNGQTGAVNIVSGVTSVNGATGAVLVSSLYDSISSSYRSTQNFYKSINLEGTYVGDYFSGTGLNYTGMTVSAFNSAVNNGCCGVSGWTTTFYLNFTQAFCDAYMPGYTPREIRNVVVKQTGYTVAWIGQAQSATWTSNNANVGHTEVVTLNQPVTSTATAYMTFNTGNIVYVNSRYSPTTWTSTLTVVVYFAY